MTSETAGSPVEEGTAEAGERAGSGSGGHATSDERRAPLIAVLQLAAVTLVVALLGLLAWKVIAGNSGSGFVADIKAGKRPVAPAFSLPVIWDRDETWAPELRPALADGQLSLAELRGHPVVVNFWASWCIPCKEEAPHLAAAARKYAGKVAFVGIDIQDFEPDALQFLRDVDAPYVSVRDKGAGSSSAYGLTGVPETFYIDRDGRVVAHALGAVSLTDLEEGIEAATR